MGRPKRLAAEQICWIYGTVTNKVPLEFKRRFALWTRAQIRVLIAQRFSVELNLVSVEGFLARLGLTCLWPFLSVTVVPRVPAGELACGALADGGVSEDTLPSASREGRDFFRGGVGCALGLSQRPNLGAEGKTSGCTLQGSGLA